MRKTFRWIGYAFLTLFVLVILVYVGLQIYLTTDSAKNLAAEEVKKIIGNDVKITELSVGVTGGTRVHIAIMPKTESETPLVDGTIELDSSGLGLASGSMPKNVTISDATITLRFDENNELISDFPEIKSEGDSKEPIPTIHVTNATIDCIYPSKPSFHAEGVNATVTQEGEKLKIAGNVADAAWGQWDIDGTWAADGSAGNVDAKTKERIAVEQKMLDTIPFVPASVWEWVQVSGNIGGGVKIGQQDEGKVTVTYQIDLVAGDATVTLPPLGTTVTDLNGRVSIDGPKVTLTDLDGKIADGIIRLDSVLDFSVEPSVLTFDAVVKNADYEKLPKEWKLPSQFNGRLTGDAKMKMTLKPDTIVYEGSGEGKLTGFKIAGGEGEATIKLLSSPNGFEFK